MRSIFQNRPSALRAARHPGSRQSRSMVIGLASKRGFRSSDMTARIIDGKAFAAGLRAHVQEEGARLKAAHGIVPGLATVLVGNDPASEVYVRNKGKTAEAIGFKSFHYALPEN